MNRAERAYFRFLLWRMRDEGLTAEQTAAIFGGDPDEVRQDYIEALSWDRGKLRNYSSLTPQQEAIASTITTAQNDRSS